MYSPPGAENYPWSSAHIFPAVFSSQTAGTSKKYEIIFLKKKR